MSWTSAFNAGLTKPIVRQLIAIINRDIQDALDWVSGTPGSYPAIAEYQLASRLIRRFPALLVTPDEVRFDADANGTLHQSMRITLGIAVTHQVRDLVVELLEDYVRALRAVLDTVNENSPADFTLTTLPLPTPLFPAGTLSPGMPAGVVTRCFVEGHSFSEARQGAKSVFEMAAAMSVIVETEES